jgi:protein-tyrosine phosphatase
MSYPHPPEDDAYRFAPAAPEVPVVYGACCPGWHTAASRETALDQWLSFMKRRGIERACCLLTGSQLDDDTMFDRYRRSFGDNVLHAPIADSRLADVDTLRTEILPFLGAAAAEDSPVVVHCLAGLGRTGHVLAAWLVYGRGYTPQEAVETVREQKRAPMEAVERDDASRRDLLDTLARVG